MATLIEQVRDAWDRAKTNGYEDQLKALTPFQLAVDMHDMDADLEKVSLEKLLPVVIDFVNNGYE